MCLIACAWQTDPEFPFVFVANRDEFHARPSEAMGWWHDNEEILAGRDLQAGGTWLAVHRSGRLSTVTNYRETPPIAAARSRGELVAGFPADSARPGDFLDTLDGSLYSGFSLLVTDGNELAYGSNRGTEKSVLAPGVYGLSNAALDTPWPKLVRAREGLRSLLTTGAPRLDDLLDLVADRRPAEPDEVPRTGLPFEHERALSSPFIVGPDYGTRCSTAIVCRQDGHVEVAERRFDADGSISGESRFVFLAGNWSAQPAP